MLELMQNIDVSILLWVQDHVRCAFLDGIMVFFSVIGNAGAVWIFAGLLLTAFKKTRLMGFDLLLVLALCYAINDLLIKNLVARPRPYESIPDLQILVQALSSWSFPSGHACSSMAAAYALARGGRGRWGMVYILAGLIAVSRLYVGVHYLTDVLFGALVGTLGAALAVRLRGGLLPAKQGGRKAGPKANGRSV